MESAGSEGEKGLRGYRVKLYPTREQRDYLESCQWELSGGWNKLVGWRREHIDACCDWYERSGAGPARPERPEDDASESEWQSYRKAAGEWKFAAVKSATGKSGPPGYQWPRHTQPNSGKEAGGYYYGTLREVMADDLARQEAEKENDSDNGSEPEPGSPGSREKNRPRYPVPAASAQAYVSLAKRFLKTKRPQPKGRGRGKRASEWRQMPLHEGSGIRIEWGDFGPGYGCQVRFGKERIRARTWNHGYDPKGPDCELVEGVSIVRERDGWYASVRVRMAPRRLPDAEPDSIVALNLGLRYLVATSDGLLVPNPRGEKFARDVQWKQQRESEGKPRGESSQRFQERAARRLDWILYNEVLPALARYETIVLHTTDRRASQGPQCRIGDEHGGYVPAMHRTALFIRQRYGERVREVPSVDISSRCSRCGLTHGSDYNREISKTGRRREHTRCKGCGLELHVDVNAARNVLANYLESLEAAE